MLHTVCDNRTLRIWCVFSVYIGVFVCILCNSHCVYPGWQQDAEDLDHYEMKEEPAEGKKSEDDGIEKENLAVLEKIRKNQRQDHLNVSAAHLERRRAGFFMLRSLLASQEHHYSVHSPLRNIIAQFIGLLEPPLRSSFSSSHNLDCPVFLLLFGRLYWDEGVSKHKSHQMGVFNWWCS